MKFRESVKLYFRNTGELWFLVALIGVISLISWAIFR